MRKRPRCLTKAFSLTFYFFFLIPFVSLIEEKCTEPLRHQTVGARNRQESWSPLSRKQDFSQSLSGHTPNPGLCLHVPSLSFRKWGTPKASGWGETPLITPVHLDVDLAVPFAGSQDVGQQNQALENLSFPSCSPSPLLPPCDTLLSLPCSLFSSPSIFAFPSAPPAACQLPADDISFHVWG